MPNWNQLVLDTLYLSLRSCIKRPKLRSNVIRKPELSFRIFNNRMHFFFFLTTRTFTRTKSLKQRSLLLNGNFLSDFIILVINTRNRNISHRLRQNLCLLRAINRNARIKKTNILNMIKMSMRNKNAINRWTFRIAGTNIRGSPVIQGFIQRNFFANLSVLKQNSHINQMGRINAVYFRQNSQPKHIS